MAKAKVSKTKKSHLCRRSKGEKSRTLVGVKSPFYICCKLFSNFLSRLFNQDEKEEEKKLDLNDLTIY